MNQIDLSDYNLGELKGLLLEVELALRNRRSQDANQAREQIAAIASEVGLSVADVLRRQGTSGRG